MEDGAAWSALSSELIRQNYAFVAAFSSILWDCLITFRQEVKYIWHCQSRLTKYLFLFCRYYALGYFILNSVSGIQWTPQIPFPAKNCKAWFLTHVASLGLLYTASQVILIRKVFNLYGGSTLLASSLFALQCTQVAGMLIWSHHISGPLNFNPICNSANFSKLAFAVIAPAVGVRFITRGLILHKSRTFQPGVFARWRRYLRTSEAHAKISWGICLTAITLRNSHAFAYQRLAPVYAFTFPITVLSIGTCRYILKIERDRYTSTQLTEVADIDELRIHTEDKGKGKERVTASQPHSYPQPASEAPLRTSSDSDALSIRTFETLSGGHNHDTVSANFPYLYGAESYKLKRNRRSMATTNTDGSADYSPRNSFGPEARQATTRTSRGSGTSLNVGAAEAVNSEMAGWRQNLAGDDEVQSASDIEVGSLHFSASVDSEDLRQFDNDTWNVGPFMVSGP